MDQPDLETDHDLETEPRRLQQHALVIEDPSGRRAVGLDAATYSLGRDPTAAIRLRSEVVSRQHALLLRLPSAEGYRYKLIDGNSEGKRSTNGIKVNGQACLEHTLQNGDVIELSADVRLTYLSFSKFSEIERAEHLQLIQFVSIKSAALSATGTLTLGNLLGQAERDSVDPTEPMPSGSMTLGSSGSQSLVAQSLPAQPDPVLHSPQESLSSSQSPPQPLPISRRWLAIGIGIFIVLIVFVIVVAVIANGF